jgi:glycosyltransferase involved in cell wall biosynthesis
MRVLHVVPSVAANHGGPSRSVPLLVKALKECGINASLAAGGAAVDHIISLKHLPVPGEVLTRDSLRRLAKAIGDSDLVEIHSLWNCTSSSAAAACRRMQIPYVLTPRGMLDPACVANHSISKSVYRHFVDEVNISGASGFHFLTDEERHQALIGRDVPDDRIAISPNGVSKPPVNLPESFLRQRYPQLLNKRVVLHLGRLDVIKRIDIQIRALAKMAEAHRPTLLLVGPDFGDERRLRTIAASVNVEDWVIFGGSIFGDERFALLAQADLIVLTSTYDCNPVVVNEGLSVGAAILATEGCGLGRLARAKAVVTVPHDVDAFAVALQNLLGTPEILADLRTRAREYSESYLGWNDVVQPLVQLYERLRLPASIDATVGASQSSLRC